MLRTIAFVLLLLPLHAWAKPAANQWYSVLLDGRKIGHFESSRSVAGDVVTTRQNLEIELDRAGTRIEVASREECTESTSGEPLAFSSISRLSGSETRVRGTVHGDSVHLQTSIGGASDKRSMPWPKGALMVEGLRLASLKVPLDPGRQFRELAFQPSSLDAVEVISTIGKRERVDLPEGSKSLQRIEQVFNFAGAPIRNTAWVDDERDVHKLTMPAMGVDLILVACSRSCAHAPNQGTNVFDRTLMPAPRALSATELASTMRYTISPSEPGEPMSLPDTSEQSVSRRDDKLLVEVSAHALERGSAPAPQDFMPNDWLQSAAPELIAIARKQTGEITGDSEKMRALETFVRGYISTKSLGVGYASALQVLHKPEGDCTEHAVLLAALGRAAGIATRVVDGLAYAPRFDQTDHVFVPHAWTQAWVDGRWRSYDAALGGFDAGHIAFSTGDGDPWRFYQGLDLLGRTRLDQAEAVPADSAQ